VLKVTPQMATLGGEFAVVIGSKNNTAFTLEGRGRVFCYSSPNLNGFG